MRVIAACAAAAALITLPALAAESETKPGSQQSKFAACAHESKGLRGEEHQKFMSECLKAHGDPDKEKKMVGTTSHARANTRIRST